MIRLCFACASVSLVLGACTPVSFSAHLGPSAGRLHETVVIEDKADPSAKVALIDVRGLIADASRPGLLSAGLNPVDEFTARLRQAAKDPAVRAVVVRINSPGGTVTASDIMYRELRRFADDTGRPVVASMGEVAASGGYYLALAADEIIAQPTTITGSIGVIFPTINVSKGLGKIGIESRAVRSAANKDIANPLEPIRDAHYAILQDLVDEFYERFRNLVIERRPGLDASRLDEITDGRVFTGSRAVELGLVDAEGDLHDAFASAKRLASVSRARLVKYHASGNKPRSPYAMADPAPARATTGTQLNLLQINLPQSVSETGGAYYLWLPAGL